MPGLHSLITVSGRRRPGRRLNMLTTPGSRTSHTVAAAPRAGYVVRCASLQFCFDAAASLQALPTDAIGLVGIRRLQLRKCLARPRLRRIVAERRARLGLGDLHRNDRGLAGVENDALRQFPVGMDADSGRGTRSAVSSRAIRKTGIRNEEQHEQRAADIEQISQNRHRRRYRRGRSSSGKQRTTAAKQCNLHGRGCPN